MTVKEANEAMWYDTTVEYNGIEYRLNALIKKKHHREPRFYYQAELKDLSANSSLAYADLERIKLKGGVKVEES